MSGFDGHAAVHKPAPRIGTQTEAGVMRRSAQKNGLSAEAYPDQPTLVLANPGDWPELWLPAEWPVERRAAFVQRWTGADMPEWARPFVERAGSASTESDSTSDTGAAPVPSTTYMSGEEFLAGLSPNEFI